MKEKKKITRRGGSRFELETIQHAIIKSGGKQRTAARMLGLTEAAISMLKKRNPEARKAIEDAKMIAMVERVRKAESVVDHHLRAKNLDAAKLVLTRTVAARELGWLDRHDDDSGSSGLGKVTNVVFSFAPHTKEQT